MTRTYHRSRTRTDGIITEDGIERMRNRIGVEIPELIGKGVAALPEREAGEVVLHVRSAP